ncbi:hypothetical protein PCAR4_180119 [Paraburkholderia caribensis]|nr:hypothetical protein PCAR4_180119 [Paraburkholderia caribensis]
MAFGHEPDAFFISALFLRGGVNQIDCVIGNRCDLSDISVMKVRIILEVDFYWFQFLSAFSSQEHTVSP